MISTLTAQIRRVQPAAACILASASRCVPVESTFLLLEQEAAARVSLCTRANPTVISEAQQTVASEELDIANIEGDVERARRQAELYLGIIAALGLNCRGLRILEIGPGPPIRARIAAR